MSPKQSPLTSLKPEIGVLGDFAARLSGVGGSLNPLSPLPLEIAHLGANVVSEDPLSVGTVGGAIGLLAVGLGVRAMTRHRRQRVSVAAPAAAGTAESPGEASPAAPVSDSPAGDSSTSGAGHQPAGDRGLPEIPAGGSPASPDD
jgi:hypothetical protein